MLTLPPRAFMAQTRPCGNFNSAPAPSAVGVAATPLMAKVGTFLAGAGFSLVFPALGVVAVKAVPQQNQGAALATYTVFMDLSLGITGPLAGLMMAWMGVSTIYIAAAGLVTLALLLGWQLKKRPQA